jgi:hypothetical protein
MTERCDSCHRDLDWCQCPPDELSDESYEAIARAGLAEARRILKGERDGRD